MKDKVQKLYVVRKFIMASSAQEALSKERSKAPDEIWVSDKELRENYESSNYPTNKPKSIGYKL